MFRIIFDALPETIFFLNSELFLSKGVSFIVSKYKLPHCVSPVVTLQANTIKNKNVTNFPKIHDFEI